MLFRIFYARKSFSFAISIKYVHCIFASQGILHSKSMMADQHKNLFTIYIYLLGRVDAREYLLYFIINLMYSRYVRRRRTGKNFFIHQGKYTQILFFFFLIFFDWCCCCCKWKIYDTHRV